MAKTIERPKLAAGAVAVAMLAGGMMIGGTSGAAARRIVGQGRGSTHDREEILGQDRQGRGDRPLYAAQRQVRGVDRDLGCSGDLAARAGSQRRDRRHRARLRFAGAVHQGKPVLRRGRRTLRQPDRAGALHARPQGIQADDQQRQEPAARRPRGLLSQGLEGRGGRGQGRPVAEADLRQPRRRRGLSRHADRQRDLHPDRRQRAPYGVHRDHRQAHGGQLDQPRLLQPVGPGRGRHPRRRADGQGRALHPGRRDVDPDRRAAQRGQHAVRLPQADCAGRAHRRTRRAA